MKHPPSLCPFARSFSPKRISLHYFRVSPNLKNDGVLFFFIFSGIFCPKMGLKRDFSNFKKIIRWSFSDFLHELIVTGSLEVDLQREVLKLTCMRKMRFFLRKILFKVFRSNEAKIESNLSFSNFVKN